MYIGCVKKKVTQNQYRLDLAWLGYGIRKPDEMLHFENYWKLNAANGFSRYSKPNQVLTPHTPITDYLSESIKCSAAK